MQHFYGRDEATFSGTTPGGVTRTFASFSQMVDDIVDARVWSGIHFRFADTEGAKVGRRECTLGQPARLPLIQGARLAPDQRQARPDLFPGPTHPSSSLKEGDMGFLARGNVGFTAEIKAKRDRSPCGGESHGEPRLP